MSVKVELADNKLHQARVLHHVQSLLYRRLEYVDASVALLDYAEIIGYLGLKHPAHIHSLMLKLLNLPALLAIE